MFGKTSTPLNRDGVTLSFGEEGDALAECDRLNASTGDFYMRYAVQKETVPYHHTHADLKRRITQLNLALD
jgi:hypothetical protein